MVTKSWIYDATIYLYALSLLFYFSDFVGRNQRSKRMGTGLLVFVWLLQTLFFTFRIMETKQPAVYSMFDSLFFFSWLMVGLALVFSFFFRIDLLVFFVNIIGFAVLALTFFSDESVSPILKNWDIEDELLFIHVSLSIGSYAAFTIGALCAGMYLFLHRKLKEKKWSETVKRLPSLDKIEEYIYKSIVIGTPLLILSLVLGGVLITLWGQKQLFWDIKVINSFIIIAAYVYYLWRKLSGKTSGYKLAQLNLWAFAIVVVNYLLTNFFSGFHQWIWTVSQ